MIEQSLGGTVQFPEKDRAIPFMAALLFCRIPFEMQPCLDNDGVRILCRANDVPVMNACLTLSGNHWYDRVAQLEDLEKSCELISGNEE